MNRIEHEEYNDVPPLLNAVFIIIALVFAISIWAKAVKDSSIKADEDNAPASVQDLRRVARFCKEAGITFEPNAASRWTHLQAVQQASECETKAQRMRDHVERKELLRTISTPN